MIDICPDIDNLANEALEDGLHAIIHHRYSHSIDQLSLAWALFNQTENIKGFEVCDQHLEYILSLPIGYDKGESCPGPYSSIGTLEEFHESGSRRANDILEIYRGGRLIRDEEDLATLVDSIDF
ncbi:MAG: hypothetical protein WC796_06300 [Candidatus Pacearchaeota archaeon]|jgi:hypothetical protein